MSITNTVLHQFFYSLVYSIDKEFGSENKGRV